MKLLWIFSVSFRINSLDEIKVVLLICGLVFQWAFVYSDAHVSRTVPRPNELQFCVFFELYLLAVSQFLYMVQVQRSQWKRLLVLLEFRGVCLMF